MKQRPSASSDVSGDSLTSVEPDEGGTAGTRTITIGLGTGLSIPLVILVAVGGFTIGRRSTTPPAATLASATAAVPAQPAPAAVIPFGGAPQLTQPQGSPGGELAAGTVLDVGTTGHPLSGAPAPEVTGKLLDGTPATLSSYVGQPLAVNFWATWCPPCRLEMPWLEEAYQKHKDQGFMLVGVNAGERTSPDRVFDLVRGFVSRTGMTFPVLMPDDPYGAQNLYQVYGLPSTYLVNKEGKVVDVVRGMFPNRATLESRLAMILGPTEATAP